MNRDLRRTFERSRVRLMDYGNENGMKKVGMDDSDMVLRSVKSPFFEEDGEVGRC